jgi:hypothetical protein
MQKVETSGGYMESGEFWSEEGDGGAMNNKRGMDRRGRVGSSQRGRVQINS